MCSSKSPVFFLFCSFVVAVTLISHDQLQLYKATTLYVAVDLCMCERDAACPLSVVGP